mgnify:CR=1 FL=1
MLDLIEAIYSAVERPSLWRRTPRLIAESLNATAFTIGEYAPGETHSRRIAAYGLDKRLLERYDAHWAMRDPWRQRTIAHVLSAKSATDFSTVHLGSLISPDEMRREPIFIELFSKLDICDGILLPLAADDSFMWITFFCGVEKSVFSKAEISAAQRLTPHLLRASRLIERRGLTGRYFSNGKLADFGAPALILSRRGEVIETNTSFKETIGARAGGRFRLGDKSVAAALEAFFAAPDDEQAFTGITIGTDSDWRLRLHHLDSLQDLLSDDGRADICLVLFERDQDAARAATSLKQRFDLTDTESEIASLLLAGRSPQQIADLRRCSISTVRWHLRQVYSKMGVTRRSDLVKRVNAR